MKLRNLSLHFLCHLRHSFEEISDDAKVCDLENRGLGILVDCNDELGVLHAGQMLNCAGNTYGNVELLWKRGGNVKEIERK